MNSTPFGFRVVGHRAGRAPAGRLAAAFAGYASCDRRRRNSTGKPILSHFTFGQDFADYLEREGSEKGYSGPCGASWLFWDIDRPDDLALALRDARRLAGAILDRYRELDDDDLLIFLSGGKGVHVGIPTAWHPEPSPQLQRQSPSSSAWRSPKPPTSRSMGRSTRRPGSSARRTPGTRRPGSSSAGSRSMS